MKDFLWQLMNTTALRAPDDEGGSGAGAGTEGGDGETQADGGDKEPSSRFAGKGLAAFVKQEGGEEEGDGKAQEGDGKPKERPAHIPEKFWDAKAGAVRTDAVVKAYSDLEAKLRNSGKVDPEDVVPEKPSVEEYFGEKIELDPEVDRLHLTPDDPGLKVAAEVFAKYGIGKKTAQSIVKDMFKGMNEYAPVPVDPEQELKALGPNGQAALNANLAWLDKLDREGKLSDEDAEFAVDLLGTARGVKFLNKMRAMAGDRSIPLGAHIPSSGGMSPEEWHQEYQEAVKKGDTKRQEELDAISAGVFGNAPSTGSPIRGLPGR